MGQTLTHGIYLPDEGERNCYNGLASNWSILDGAVGTVAEHTTALAGKASASHSHGNITNDGKVGTAANKPLITGTDGVVQAGSFGNQANTFCEGNDSRLSDARTPVAHTHTKADVTDLFNSANTWTGEQTFSVPCKTLGKKLLTGITDLDDAYYNGEVCGFNPNTLHNPTGGYGNVLTINNAVNIPDNVYSSWITQIATTPDGTYLGTRNRSNGGAWTSWTRILTEDHAVPILTNTYDLGTSTNKWKTLNGINPGALSLPNFSAEFDVSGQIVPPTGETQINIAWGKNTFTPSVDGWLSIRIHKATVIKIYRESRASYCFDSRIATADDICVCSPVVAGVEYTIKIQATQFSSGYDHFRLSPCQGNV